MAALRFAGACLALSLLMGPAHALAEMRACQYAYGLTGPKAKVRAFTACLERGNGVRESAVVYMFRGQAYAELTDFDAALRDYPAAIKLIPSLDPAYIFRGEIYANRGDFSQAQADFEAAARLTSDRWNHSAALNQEAWLFATWPEASRRDAAK